MRITPALQGLISGVPCFILASTFMKTWLDPSGGDSGQWIRMALGLLLLEFLLIHSGGFLYSNLRGKPDREKRKVFAFAFGLYGIFAVSWAVAMRSWTVITIYTWVMLSRWTGELAHPENVSREFLFRSRAAALSLMLVVVLAVVVPWPQLGLAGAVKRQLFQDGADSDLARYPHNILAAAVMYFTLMGITELVIAARSFGRSPRGGQSAHS